MHRTCSFSRSISGCRSSFVARQGIRSICKAIVGFGIVCVLYWHSLCGHLQAQEIVLTDVSKQASLDFEHFSGRTGQHFIIETVTSGIATLDYDGDGLIDIYLPSGCALDPNGDRENEADSATGDKIGFSTERRTNRLFKNLGNFRFRDVTDEAGAGDDGFALGCLSGDVDNDGDPDLVVLNFGVSVVLENCGDGTFHRRELAGDSSKARVAAGGSLLDFDSDGNLDLYVSRYVDFDFEKKVARKIFGVPAAPGPKDYTPDTDALYRNDGSGNFFDVSTESGIEEQAGPGMATLCFDYDRDGDTDIFVCNDSAANFLMENQGDGTFLEAALLAGVAYDVTGSQQASMGVDIADVNRDGHLDLVTTNFADEVPTLYSNSGQGYFDDVGAAAGLGRANRSVTWGVGLVDFDNDGWEDCFIAAGHLIDVIEKVDDSSQFRAPHVVLRNTEGKFTSDGVSGTALDSVDVSRGIALDDFDRDGLIDGIVLNLDSSPQVFQNQSPSTNHYVNLRLIGRNSNRDAVGARVELTTANGEMWVKEVVRGRGYQSDFGNELHFGLGSNQRVQSLKVYWHRGHVDEFEDLEINRNITVIEGQVIESEDIEGQDIGERK